VGDDSTYPPFDVMSVLTDQDTRCPIATYQEDQIIYSQGNPVDSVFYIRTGRVKVTVISELGKEAIVAIRGPDEFCGEGALAGETMRLATATAMSPCEILRLDKKTLGRVDELTIEASSGIPRGNQA
jgi:CRP-like cAMP-binding protein